MGKPHSGLARTGLSPYLISRRKAAKVMAKIIFVEAEGQRHEVDVAEGVTVMEGARIAGVPGITADCNGACACATCHSYLEPSWMERLGAPDSREEDMLDFAPGYEPVRSRLTCQITVTAEMDGMVVTLPEEQL